MGSVPIKELSIEDAFGKCPISSRDRGPFFHRIDKQTVPGTMSSSGRSISSDTASVHASPSSLIPKASLKCFSIKEGFVKAQIPGDIEALIPDTSVQPAINNALGSVSADQTVAVNGRKNESAVVGREGKKQLSDFDRGSMSWFGMCFRGSVQT